MWLLANPTAKVYSFDIGEHTCTRIMAERLKQRFGDRFTITFGDSTKTLPQFHTDHPEIKCDLVIADGGHSPAITSSDLETMYKMVAPLNFVFMDNHPDKYKLGVSWESLKRKGILLEFFRCQYSILNTSIKKYHGFTFGQFLVSDV